MGPGEMGGLFWIGTFQTRKGPQCYISRDIRDGASRHGAPTQDCKGFGLGGEFLAQHKERQEQRISKGTTVLLDGCRWSLDGLAHWLCGFVSVLSRSSWIKSLFWFSFWWTRSWFSFQIFYFIRPTPANLAAYEKWSGSELQYQVWLGDLVDEVYKVELVEGNTMIIPTGWIHAVVSVNWHAYMKMNNSGLAHACGHGGIWRQLFAFIRRCNAWVAPLMLSICTHKER